MFLSYIPKSSARKFLRNNSAILPSSYFLFLAFRCWQVEKSIACKSWISAEFLWFPSSTLQQTINMSPLSEKFLIEFMKRLLNSRLKWNTLVYSSWCHRCQAMNSSSASPRALSSSGEAAAPRPLRRHNRPRRKPATCLAGITTAPLLEAFSNTLGTSSSLTHIQLLPNPTCHHKEKKPQVPVVQFFLPTSINWNDCYKKHLKSLIQKKEISMSWNYDIFM